MGFDMKGWKGFVLGIVVTLIVLAVVILSLLYYFYNVHVFETVRVCMGKANNTGFSCDTTQDCFDYVGLTPEDIVEEIPPFLQSDFRAILDAGVYCNQTCQVRLTRGIDYKNRRLELIEECRPGEKEFVKEIRGRDALEALQYVQQS